MTSDQKSEAPANGENLLTTLANLGAAVRFAQKWQEYLRAEALPTVTQRVIPRVNEAQELLDAGFYGASVVAAYSALELALRTAIVRPFVLAGSLSPELAELVAERVLRSSGQELRRVTRELTGLLGIEALAPRAPDGELIWNEIANSLAPLRNRVVHEGATATKAEAEVAAHLAAQVLHDVVLPIFGSIGLAPEQHPDWSAQQALMEQVGRLIAGEGRTRNKTKRA